MRPTDRYLATRGTASVRTWRVLDTQTRPDPSLMVGDIPTGRLAMEIKAALVAAYWAGADAVKTGEVVI